MNLLHGRVDDLRIREWFGVVGSLAIVLVLETLFIDKYLRGIFPAECKLVPLRSRPVDIIVSTTKTANAATIVDFIGSQPSSAPLADEIYRRVVVAKEVRLAPHAHAPVLL